MNIKDYTTEELVEELSIRQVLPVCKCGKWKTYMGAYDSDGYTLRCHGCLKAISKCGCR